MTDLKGHPIRRAPLHIFQRTHKDALGAAFIARFHPYDTWPVFFHGQSAEEAERKAEAFRSECIKKHEAAVLRRQEQAAARKKKKDAA